MSSGSGGLRYIRRSSRNAAAGWALLVFFGGIALSLFAGASTAQKGGLGMGLFVMILGLMATIGLGLAIFAEAESGTDSEGCERIDQAIDAMEKEIWRASGKAPSAIFQARHQGELGGILDLAGEDQRLAFEAVDQALLDGATHPARLEDLLLRRIATTRRLGVLMRFASPARAEALLKEAYGLIGEYKETGSGGRGFLNRKSLLTELDWTEGGEKRWGDSVVGLTYDPND